MRERVERSSFQVDARFVQSVRVCLVNPGAIGDRVRFRSGPIHR